MHTTEVDPSTLTPELLKHYKTYGTLPRTVTASDRKAEIRRLEFLLDTNRLIFDEWSHIRNCVGLQVKVIRDPEMDLAPYDLDGDEGGSPLTENILQRALNAREWADGHGGPSPSQEWREQLCELITALGEA